jgi:hypothetical protein
MPNPTYTSWVARHQEFLGYLLSLLTCETLLHVSRCTTMAHAWGTLVKLYSSYTRALSVNTQIALATMKKNQLSVSHYYSKMTQFADDLAVSGAPLHDDELVAYLLASLDEEYNPVFTSVVARVDLITPSELYSQLLSFEQHTSLQGSSMHGGASSAMTVSRGAATPLVVGVLALPLVAQAVVVVVAVAAPNEVASPINKVMATTPHLPPSPSVKFAPRLDIPPRSGGISTTMTPLPSPVQRASRPLMPPRTCGTLIPGQQTILPAILTN